MANNEIQKDRENPEPVRARPAVAPRVDIYENRQEFLVVTDLPGVIAEDLGIQVENAELTLEATRRSPVEGALLFGEYREADYRRSFLLPQGIDRDKIDAELKDGVLRLHLPKADALRPRQIQVRGG